MDELDEIKRKKMEKMMKDMNKPPAPSIELPDKPVIVTCLLYTSDAADDLLCLDLGGRRIIKYKTPTPRTYVSSA